MKDFLEGFLREMCHHALSNDYEGAHSDADTLLTLLCITLANEAFCQPLREQLPLKELILNILAEYRRGHEKWGCS